MARKLFKLGVFLLIAHALYQVAPVWWHYRAFKEAVADLALNGRGQPDSAILDGVMELAGENQVPLDRDSVQIRRDHDRLFVDAAYVEDLKVLPGYQYPWQFDVNVATWFPAIGTAPRKQ